MQAKKGNLSSTRKDLKIMQQVNYFSWTLVHECVHLLAVVPFLILVYRITGNIKSVAFCLSYTLFMDIDHLFDYIVHKGIVFDINYIKNVNYFYEADKMYLPLHGFEYVAIFLGATLIDKSHTNYFMALAIAVLNHLLVDQFYYAPLSLRHFLSYRAYVNFRLSAM